VSADPLLVQAFELARRGEPFALATVVRCERPTSAKPGAKALVRPDGTVVGWIGGSCAEPLVVREALAALGDGQPRLLALAGEETRSPGSPREGVREHAMPCHSGGTLEIYVEPVLPQPSLVLVGGGPVAATLATLAGAVGFEVTGVADERELAGVPLAPGTAVVVATHGRFDEAALERVLKSEARYVSLVASPKRARAVVETLAARDVPTERLKAPAGLDLGAVTPEEIAVSILAEIIQARRPRPPEPGPAAAAPALALAAEALDPICGMTVATAGARYLSEVADRRVYFCGAGCKRRFDQDPGKYGLGTR
jgi:xanthine dehydrogenase accessory factor